MTKKSVLMIGLDAAEPSLIEHWMATGYLPNLARLRVQGAYGRISMGKEWIAATPWPSFYTGSTVGEHGFYQFLQWRSELMKSIRPNPDWLPLEPFWRRLSASGPRVVVVDVPLTYPPQPFNGIELSAWASHDWLGPPSSNPEDLLREVTDRLGMVPRQPEIHQMLDAEQMLAQRDELIEVTRKVADLGAMLITENPWDFFLICFGATHRAGHKLWDLTSVSGNPSPDQTLHLEHALRDIYVTCDKAIGRLLDKVAPETDVIVFSLHGMGPNNSRLNILPEMLDRVLAAAHANKQNNYRPEKYTLINWARNCIPEKWRERVKRRLPLRVQDQLTSFWRFGNTDWNGVRAFPLVGDLHGYVRLNVVGREKDGIIYRGKEYDTLCDEIEGGLQSFVDVDSNRPIVESVVRTDVYFPDGERRELLPDLIVRWSEMPSACQRLISSERFGLIDWPAPGQNPDGRSGNHRHEGMVFIRSPGVRAGAYLDDATLYDLVPTVYRLFDIRIPDTLIGRSLV